MPVELLSPSPQPPGSHPPGLPGRLTWQCPYSLAECVLDTTAFDFHLDVSPDHPRYLMPPLIERLQAMGYEPLPEDECEPELLDNGWTRIYFVPIFPMDDMVTEPVLPKTIPAPRVPEEQHPHRVLSIFMAALLGLTPHISAPAMIL